MLSFVAKGINVGYRAHGDACSAYMAVRNSVKLASIYSKNRSTGDCCFQKCGTCSLLDSYTLTFLMRVPCLYWGIPATIMEVAGPSETSIDIY